MQILSHPRIQRHLGQGLRFVLVGGTAAMVDLGGSAFFVHVLSLSPYIATGLSTACAVTMVFLGNKFFTFKNRNAQYGNQLAKFAIVYGAAIVENLSVTWVLIHLGFHFLFSKVVAIGVGVLWNYSMSHYFVFKKNPEQEEEVLAF